MLATFLQSEAKKVVSKLLTRVSKCLQHFLQLEV